MPLKSRLPAFMIGLIFVCLFEKAFGLNIQLTERFVICQDAISRTLNQTGTGLTLHGTSINTQFLINKGIASCWKVRPYFFILRKLLGLSDSFTSRLVSCSKK